MADPCSGFREAMGAAGLNPPADLIADGQLQRFNVDGDRRYARNGWYVVFPDDLPAGAFGCWKRGIRETWSAKPERDFSAAEREAWRRRMAEAKGARELEERKRAASIRREYRVTRAARREFQEREAGSGSDDGSDDDDLSSWREL